VPVGEEGETGGRLAEIHRRLHAKPRPPRYRPVTVAEALGWLRRSLEASILLGLYGFLWGDEEAAAGIVDTEREIDEVAYQLLAHVAIAVGRSLEGATHAAPIYTYVMAVDKVMDALKDLASLTLRGHRLSPGTRREILALSDEPVARVSGLQGVTVGQLLEEYGVDVLAVKRGSGGWLLSPGNEVEIGEGDTAYVRGAKEAVNELLERTGHRPLPDREEGPLRDIPASIEMLLVMNELAHYQLRAQDAGLAEEILDLEMFMDELRVRNSQRVLRLGLGLEDEFLLLSLVTRIEDVSDALTYIIVMPAEEEYREVLSTVTEAAGERIALYTARARVALVALAEALDDIGARALAARKRGEWVALTPYNIEALVLEPGDAVLVEYDDRVRRRAERLLHGLGLAPAGRTA